MKRLFSLLTTCFALLASASAETIYALTSENELISFQSATPNGFFSRPPISGLQAGERLVGIDFRPRTGGLYGIGVVNDGSTDDVRLYRLDPETAEATLISAAPISVTAGAVYGMDFNPTVDRIRVVNSADENFRLNPNNGARADAPVNDTDLNGAGNSIDGVAYDRNFNTGTAVAARTTLYGIARTGSRLVTIGGINQSPLPNGGVVNTVGTNLGVLIAPTGGIGFDISSNTGTAFATWVDAVNEVTRLFQIDLSTGLAAEIGLLGGGDTDIEALCVAPATWFVFGPAGRAYKATIFDFLEQHTETKLRAFAGPQRGGVRVAAGDVNRDGYPDVVVGAGNGSAPEVIAFDGKTGTELFRGLAADLDFNGGVNVAAGDINGDGFADIITATGPGIESEVRVYSGQTGVLLNTLVPFPGFTGGVNVAASDFDLDGDAELVVGSGPGLAPVVRVYAGATTEIATFNPYPSTVLNRGVLVAAGRQPNPTIVTSQGKASGEVQVFKSPTASPLAFALNASFTAFGGRNPGGVRVALFDFDLDGFDDFLTVPGAGRNSSRVRFYDGETLAPKGTFVPFISDGAFVAGGR